MKNYLFILSLVVSSFVHAVEKKKIEKIEVSVLTVDPRFKAKNSYSSNVPVDVIKECDRGNQREIIILPNLGLGFGINPDYYSPTTDVLPQVLKTAKTETTMLISGISPNLSKFYIDLKIKSNLLKGALSEEEASELVTRYVAKVVSCDGEELRFGTDSRNVRDLIQDLAEQDFDQYLGCKLQLTLATPDKSFAPDPFNFEKNYKEKYSAYTGAAMVTSFTLVIGPHGNATFDSGAPVTAGIQVHRQSRNSIFTLKANMAEESPSKEIVLKAAHNIAKVLVAYADDQATSTSPDSKSAESSAIEKASFNGRSEELKGYIHELRSKFSDLSIQDQFLALTIVGRAYHYVDEVEARLKKMKN